MPEDSEHPLDAAIDSLENWQTLARACDSDATWEDLARDLLAVIEDLEKERERTR